MNQQKINAIYPTTPSQQGFVLGTVSHPEAALFVEQAVFPLAGPLDAGRLAQVWQELVQRHDILRTAFAWDLSDHPRQVIMSHADLAMEVVDARGQSAEEQDGGVGVILNRHLAVPFDLKRPPLMQLAVQLRTDQEHALVWTHHHAILDGWSQMSLLSEMLEHYNGRDGGATAPPPFGQFARWMARRDFTPHQSFWTAFLQGYSPPETLPVLPSSNGTARFGTHVAEMARAEVDALDRVARGNDLTMSSIILGVWSMIAARLRGVEQIVVGVTTSGRPPQFPEVAAMIGPFANTIPLRTTIDADRDFGSWVRLLPERLSEAAQFGDCSAGQVHRWAALPSDRPLFDSIVAIGNYPQIERNGADSGQLRVLMDAIEAYGGRTLQPLTLVGTTMGGLKLRLVNDRWRIADAVAADALRSLCSALSKLAPHGTSTRVGELLEGTSAPGPLEYEGNPWEEGGPSGSTLEAVIAKMFAKVLNRESVAVDADFLALGGHSLLAIELLAVLRSALAVDLTLQDLIANPTPAGVARREIGRAHV